MRQRIPGELRGILAAALVSYTGSGLTLPFLLIYFHQVRGLALGVAGLLVGAIGVVSLPASPLAGVAVDRWPLRTLASVVLTLQALGTGALTLVHSVPTAAVAVLLLGVGLGAGYPVWYVVLSTLVGDEALRPRVFSVHSQLVNLGTGVGSLLGALVVDVAHPASFVAIYLADGASTMLIVLALLSVPARRFAARRPDTGPAAANAGGYRVVLADRKMVCYLLVTVAVALGGYGAMTVGFVGFATSVAKVAPRTVAVAIAVNTALLVAAQPLALRAVDVMRRTSALTCVAGFFGATWVVLGLAGLRPGSLLGSGLVIAAQVVFAAGEVFLSPVSSPLTNDLAPDALRGRYNAAASTAVGLAEVVGPTLAGAVLGSRFAPAYLLLPIVFCAIAVLLLQRLDRLLSPAQNFVRTMSYFVGRHRYRPVHRADVHRPQPFRAGYPQPRREGTRDRLPDLVGC